MRWKMLEASPIIEELGIDHDDVSKNRARAKKRLSHVVDALMRLKTPQA